VTAASMAPQPCKWCGRLISRPVRRREHEGRCNANPAARWSLDGERPTTKNAYNTWQKAQAEDRIRRIFAQVDLTAEPVEVQRQMMALGVPSEGAARHLIRRGMRMGVVPTNLRRRIGENRTGTANGSTSTSASSSRMSAWTGPSPPRSGNGAATPARRGLMAERARQLGLIPVDFRFPSHEPADMRKPSQPRERLPKKPKATSAKLKVKPAPNSVVRPRSDHVPRHAQLPGGQRSVQQATHLVTRSALDGDAVRPRCPNAGCAWEGNTFRLRRHLDECPYRDEEDECG
jgi:hypothetical protein